MWVSEVKTKRTIKRGRFCHRRTFDQLDDGLNWARDLAFKIIDGPFWSDEDIVTNHFEIPERTKKVSDDLASLAHSLKG